MQIDDGAEVDARQHVAVEDDDGAVEVRRGEFDGPAGTERLGLDQIADPRPARTPFGRYALDGIGLVVEAQYDFVDLREPGEQVELVVQERPVEDWHHGLRRAERERAQAGAEAAHQQDGLHGIRVQYGPLAVRPECAMNLPNTLTLARIFLVPLLVVVLLTRFEAQLILGVPKEVIGAAIFGLAAFTDWLDGYLARRRQQVTALGQLMDPLADKLLITAALISLVQMGLAPAWMVMVILGRELGVTVLRSLVHARGVVIPASPLGKVKMVAQVVAILLLMLSNQVWLFLVPGLIALWVVLAVALWSAADYYRRYNRVLSNSNVANFEAARRRAEQSRRAG